jgi:hypothetical protein
LDATLSCQIDLTPFIRRQHSFFGRVSAGI